MNYQREAYKYKNGDYPSDMSALFGNQDYTDAYNAGKWIDWIDEAAGKVIQLQPKNIVFLFQGVVRRLRYLLQLLIIEKRVY